MARVMHISCVGRMLIRTVLDCRPGDPKFYAAICLLIASWSRCLKTRAPLQILAVGQVPQALRSFISDHGADLRGIQGDPDLSFVATGNTLLGGEASVDGQRILLIDNDTVFLRPPDELDAVPEDKLGGANSGSDRISDANWCKIEQDLNLPTLPGGQILDKSRLDQMRSPTAPLVRLPRGYINGGVLLLPKDPKFVLTWKRHIIRIRDHFEGRTDQQNALCRSNMAGLATATAAHGGAYWLDDGLNYRHYHFLLNARPLDRICILHMTGYPRFGWPTPEHSGVSGYVDTYWRSRILEPLVGLRPNMPESGWSDAMETSDAVHDHLLSVVSELDLDQVFAAIMETVPPARHANRE